MTNLKSALGRTLAPLVLTVSILTPALARAATLVSDKPDYAPLEIATLTGAGFEPGEWVVIQVQHDDDTPDSGEGHGTWLVQADTEGQPNPGGFVTTWTVCGDDCLGSTLRATAIGESSLLEAWVVFTDASQFGCSGGDEPRADCPLPSDITGACFWGCGHVEGNGTLQCSPNRYDNASTGTTCRPAAGVCDVAETCSGSSGTCPADGFLPTSTVCRSAAGECDLAENCTGSADCPSDAKQPATTACTADSNPCTLDECDGSSDACQHPAGNAGTTCRSAAGVCDQAETCDGTTTTCPTDTFLPTSTVCRSAAGECDLAENCTGSADCPSDAKQPAETACTADSNPCTLDECDGSSDACQHPAGNAGTTCRSAAGVCDQAETCDGTNTTCPTDTFLPTSTVCRSAAGDCDLAESCTGSADCPSDAKQPAETACTADSNPCTLDECDGSSDACQHPAGNAGTTCRSAAGVCDQAETCDGTNTTCPTDTFLPTSTVCRSAAGDCDLAENCTGTTAGCPTDTFKGSGTVCRSSAGVCDMAESCSGTSAGCPADGFKSSATVCRPDAGECDVAENCTGSSASCPADTKEECSVVTDSSLCPFDVADGNTCGGGSQFRLVFTPDVQKWPAYKLNATNPGQTYYNGVVNGPAGEEVPLEVHVPYPYVTVGGQPLHVYDAVPLSFLGGCFVPPSAIQNESVRIVLQDYQPKCVGGVCSNGAGSCSGDSACVPNDSGPYGLTCVPPSGTCDGPKAGTPAVLDDGYCTFTVDVKIPASGQAYVNLHLDYGLKGPHVDACSDGMEDRYDAKPVTGGYDALENLDETSATAYDDDLAGDLIIPQCQDYMFGHACESPGTCAGMDTVSSVNEFKKIGGVVGQLMSGANPVSGTQLRLLKGSTLVASGTTDGDGFYLLGYKHTGKAADFTVQVVGSTLKQLVTLKANGFAEVDFDAAAGTSTIEYGAGWTPK